MRRAILGSIGALVAAAPLGLAQPPRPAPAFSPPALATDLPDFPLTAPPLPGQLPANPNVPPADPMTPAPGTPGQLPPTEGTPAPEPLATTPAPGPAQAAPATAASAAAAEPPATKFQDTHVGPREQVWFDAGYRLWWIKDSRIGTPLITTGPTAGGPTTPVFGASDINYGSFNGLNLDLGLWLDCRHTIGFEMGGFYFGRQDVTDTFSSDAAGNPFIARPFTSALTNTPAALIVSSPGVLSGTVTAETASRLAGANANFVKNIYQCENYTIDSLFGFRYIDLEERLDVTQQSTPLNGGTLAFGGGALPPGVGLSLADSFATRNQFYGGVIGSRGEWRFGAAFIDLSSTVALGPDHETLQIYGRTTALTPGGATLPGGLLAVGGGTQTVLAANGQPTAFLQQGNIGRFTTNRFVAAPEASVQAGAYVTSHIKLAVGYNFLYMTDVIRPGQQVNTDINTRFAPSSPAFGSTSGQPLPTVTGRREDFHAQGLTFSAEVKY